MISDGVVSRDALLRCTDRQIGPEPQRPILMLPAGDA
jgi:hypothetical protein